MLRKVSCSDLHSLILPPRRPLVLGGGKIILELIRPSPTLAIYKVVPVEIISWIKKMNLASLLAKFINYVDPMSRTYYFPELKSGLIWKSANTFVVWEGQTSNNCTFH